MFKKTRSKLEALLHGKEPTLPETGKLISELTPEHLKALEQSWAHSRTKLAENLENWGIEILKHLVLINGVGLAGAFALFQRPGFPASLVVTLLYLTGLLTACVAMYLQYLLYRDMQRNMIRGLQG